MLRKNSTDMFYWNEWGMYSEEIRKFDIMLLDQFEKSVFM